MSFRVLRCRLKVGFVCVMFDGGVDEVCELDLVESVDVAVV